MKGIKKLFFGLIFMTLVGVGFKVDVKAHDLSVSEPASPYSWEDDGMVVTAKFTKKDIEDILGGVESGSDEVTISLWSCNEEGEPDNEVGSATVKLIKYGKNSYDVMCSQGDVKGNWTVTIPMPKGDVYEQLIGEDGVPKKYTFFRASSDFYEDDKYTNPKKVEAYKVTAEAYYNNGRRASVEFDPDSGFIYLLKGDTGTISIDYGELKEKGYIVTKAENVIGCDDPGDGVAVITVDGKGKAYSAKVTLGVDKEFIDLDIDDGHKVGQNYWSREIEYELYNCSEEDLKVYFDGKQLHLDSSYVMDSNIFRFKVPYGTSAGTKVLKFVREGGAEQQYKIQVVDTNKITFTIDDPIVTFKGYEVIVTPQVGGGAKMNGYTLDDGGSSYFEADERNYTSFIVRGIDEGSGDKLIVTPEFDVDMYKTNDTDEQDKGLTVKPKVVVYDELDYDVDDVYVINGMKIKLSKFISGYDSSMSSLPVNVQLTSKAKGYIGSSGTTLGKAELSGKSSGHVDDGISVDGGITTADVTVYPKPSITLDSSSSSSSSSSYSNASYKFTVKMPAGDYHDDWMVSSLGTVEFTVIGSSGEEKSMKKVSSGSSSSSSSVLMSRSFTTTITAREMADALGKSSDSVKIRAYAYDGDKRDDKVYAEYSLSYNTGSSSSSSSSSSSGSGKSGEGGSGSEYDDVPKTGESKTDIWVLWTVLFIAILGAGFMIYKRFGLVRAIAEAEEEVAAAEHEERVEAARKEKEDKINMLKDLRNL